MGGFTQNEAIRYAHLFFHFKALLKRAWQTRKMKKPDFCRASFWVAVREGFEPSVPFPVRQFSKLFLSATQAPHRICACKRNTKKRISETLCAKKTISCPTNSQCPQLANLF